VGQSAGKHGGPAFLVSAGHLEHSALNLNEQHYWAETAQQTTGETPVPLLRR
jgi:hypothetical protein